MFFMKLASMLSRKNEGLITERGFMRAHRGLHGCFIVIIVHIVDT